MVVYEAVPYTHSPLHLLTVDGMEFGFMVCQAWE